MNRKTILIVAALAVVEVVTSFSPAAKADGAKYCAAPITFAPGD